MNLDELLFTEMAGRKELGHDEVLWRQPYSQVLDIITEFTMKGLSITLAQLTEIGILPHEPTSDKPLSKQRVLAVLRKLIRLGWIVKAENAYQIKDLSRLKLAKYITERIRGDSVITNLTSSDLGVQFDAYRFSAIVLHGTPMDEELTALLKNESLRLLKSITTSWCKHVLGDIRRDIQKVLGKPGLTTTERALFLIEIRRSMISGLDQLGWLSPDESPNDILLEDLGIARFVKDIIEGYGLVLITDSSARKGVGQRINVLEKGISLRKMHQKRMYIVSTERRRTVRALADSIARPLEIRFEPIVITKVGLSNAPELVGSGASVHNSGPTKTQSDSAHSLAQEDEP